MEVIEYDKQNKEQWEQFILTSNNGTIFHTRKFLSYHPAERFKDNSLLFLNNNKILSVLTAADIIRDDRKLLISHQGASYGGFVYKDNLSIKDAFKLTESLIEYAIKKKFDRIVITHSPFVYQKRYNNYIDFALIRNGFGYIKREVSSVISLDVSEDDVFSLFKQEARTAVRRAEKLGVKIRNSDDFEDYYKILENNLAMRHNVNPAHSLEDLLKLKKLFPDKIQLVGAYLKEKMIAGVVNFYCNEKVVLVFYISNNMEYQNYRAVNLLFFEIIKDAIRRGLGFLDFGLFTVNMDPNWGLGKFKENFGARGILRDTFYLDI
ncbi:MAG: peptidoglycan bridge formation glycyltransferase FemA/FemB family protein [Ignavibacteria bacterium]